jgi:membrane-associated protease RseP (regulator of RpoE activity)
MAQYPDDPFFSSDQTEYKPPKVKSKIGLPIFLYILTFITTVIAGYEWQRGGGGGYELKNLVLGLPYAFAILFFLASHEFGHYFASRYHQVKTSLPYFIPFYGALLFLNFGTLGAVIRTKSAIPSKKALFDIGAAGPIAGFFASLIILTYGFTHLPGKEFLLSIHPDYGSGVHQPNSYELIFGDNLLFSFLRAVLTKPTDFIPPMSEIYHYPYLCAGWFGLFVTSMNLIPVGQLDGGHICYAVFGERLHNHIASISMIALIILGVLGTLKLVYFSWLPIGWYGWFFWAAILYLVVKVNHPPVYDYLGLDAKRQYLGYFSMFIFILTFSPSPFIIQ